MRQLILFAVFAFLFASCDRNMVFDATTVKEPSLTVIAERMTGTGSATTYTKVNGAEVKLYNNQADFNANAAPFKSKTTGADGKALFTKAELVAKGVFYVRVTSGTLTGTGTSQYLLLNDGETNLNILLN